MAISGADPGGGRIRDKKPAQESELVTLRGHGGKRIKLHQDAAAAYQAMVAAAARDGIAPSLLAIKSGFRTPEEQQKIWEKNLKKYGTEGETRKYVAPPGRSAHQTGRTVDLSLGIELSPKRAGEMRGTEVHRWLVANASNFGFYPYPREPWHWEFNPPRTQGWSPTAPKRSPWSFRLQPPLLNSALIFRRPSWSVPSPIAPPKTMSLGIPKLRAPTLPSLSPRAPDLSKPIRLEPPRLGGTLADRRPLWSGPPTIVPTRGLLSRLTLHTPSLSQPSITGFSQAPILSRLTLSPPRLGGPPISQGLGNFTLRRPSL